MSVFEIPNQSQVKATIIALMVACLPRWAWTPVSRIIGRLWRGFRDA